MATIEGGITLDPGGLDAAQLDVLNSVVAGISAALGEATPVVTENADGSKTISQDRDQTIEGLDAPLATRAVVIQPSTAEGSTSAGSGSLSGDDSVVNMTVSVPAGVILSANGPDQVVDVATAAKVAASNIQDAETKAFVESIGASDTQANVVIKTVTPIASANGNGTLSLSSAASDNNTVEGGAVSVMVVQTSQLNPNITVELDDVPFLILDGGAQASGDQALTAAESEYGAAIRVGTGSTQIYGSSSSEILYGGAAGSDRIEGGSGDDVIYAGSGGASYIGGGKGADTLVGNLSGLGGNTIEGGQGNDNLVASSTKTEALDTFLDANAGVTSAIDDQRQFAGLRALVDAEAGDAPSVILGDTFVFGDNSGVDYVFNFHAGVDVLQIAAGVNGSSVASAADVLANASQVGDDTYIALGGGNAIILAGVSVADLSADGIIIG